MPEAINGFLVVRKSKSMSETDPYQRRFKIGDKEYEGIERPHLYDVNEDFFKKIIPVELQRIIEKNNTESNDNTFMPFIKEFEDARKVFEYSALKNDLNEIIAIKSEKLSSIKGLIDFRGGKIDWLGYDIISFGMGSLIFMGIFSKPNHFKNWTNVVNKHGLFTNIEDAEGYIDDYLKLAKANIVEDHVISELGFEFIKIGRPIWF